MVHIITKGQESQPKGKNVIFLVNSAAELEKWDYDYGSLFYAIDFQSERRFYFDY